MERKPYLSDVSDDEWALVAPSLTLMSEDAPQREHPLREVFNGLRWIVRAGTPWRMLPNDLPPWEAVYQQTQRWLQAGVCEAMVNDWRALLRLAAGRSAPPSAVIFDSREKGVLPGVYANSFVMSMTFGKPLPPPGARCARGCWTAGRSSASAEATLLKAKS